MLRNKFHKEKGTERKLAKPLKCVFQGKYDN